MLWSEQRDDEPPEGARNVSEASQSAPIIRIFNTILMYAIRDGAEEISLTPNERNTTIRYRINGKWREQMKVPLHVHAPLIARIEAMCTRGAWGDAITVRLGDKTLSWRVWLDPGEFGLHARLQVLAWRAEDAE